MTLETLAALYKKKFGTVPEIVWTDNRVAVEKELLQAVKTGVPWKRRSEEMEEIRT